MCTKVDDEEKRETKEEERRYSDSGEFRGYWLRENLPNQIAAKRPDIQKRRKQKNSENQIQNFSKYFTRFRHCQSNLMR